MAGESQETPGSRPDPTVLTTEQLVRELGHLEALVEAKLETVDVQFRLIEDQRIELKGDTATAVNAALTSAKDAVAAVDKSVDDLKERLVKMESTISGERRVTERAQDRVQPWHLAVVAVVMGIVSLAANGRLG